jgi:glycosyltransferase involved in cell wall biosynthesis
MLGVIVMAVGRPSETYLAQHIARLSPGRTVVCSLGPCDEPKWAPAAAEFKLYESEHGSVEALRRIASAISPRVLNRLDTVRVVAWLVKHRIDVVLCEFLQVAIAFSDVCRRMRIPVVAHAHGFDLSAQTRDRAWERAYREKLPLMNEIVVVSRLMRERVESLGVPADRVHVIPCGTEIDEITDPCLPVRRKRFKAVAVGRLIAKKGPIFLLEAFRRIRHAGVDVELCVIGGGPFLEPMRQFVLSTGLEADVHLLGNLTNDDVKKHLRDADVFLLHSVTADNGDEEGLPVAILEAMAAGVPVVSTRHAGIPEAVRDGRTGFLVEPRDCQAMANRVIELLQCDRLRSQMGRAARDVVVAEFSLEREIEGLRSVLAKYQGGGR